MSHAVIHMYAGQQIIETQTERGPLYELQGLDGIAFVSLAEAQAAVNGLIDGDLYEIFRKRQLQRALQDLCILEDVT